MSATLNQSVLPPMAADRMTNVSWTPPGPPCDLLRATYRGHSFMPHVHTTYAIGVVTDGCALSLFRDRRSVVATGTVVTVDPGEVHTGEPADESGWSSRMLYPSEPMLQLVAEGVGIDGPPRFNRMGVQDRELAGWLVAAHRAIESGTDALRAEALLLESLTMLVLRHGDRPAPAMRGGSTRVARQARAYIDLRRGARIVLQEMASEIGVGIFSLIRAFRKSYGLAPYVYAESVRIEHARQLLRDGESIAAVAYRAGFADQSHLTRQFKRMVGLTPARYAQRVTRGTILPARCTLRVNTAGLGAGSMSEAGGVPSSSARREVLPR